jgi:hypothetical protein
MSAGEVATNLERYLEPPFQPNGVIYKVAEATLVPGQAAGLDADTVGDLLLPPKREDWAPRWQMQENAKEATVTAANAHEAEVYLLAAQLGMRQETSLMQGELNLIDAEKAIWTVEGGANLSSVMRRGLCIVAMQQVYGEQAAASKVMYQFAGGREIPETLNGKPNTEYAMAKKLAGQYLPEGLIDGKLDEFGVALTSALNDGYVAQQEDEATAERQHYIAQRIVRLRKEGMPELVLVQPRMVESTGLENGLLTVTHLNGLPEGSQFVLVSNGQYRPKDKLQADRLTRKYGLYDEPYKMQPPVALGDEPGFTVTHNGVEYTTPERKPTTYVNEVVVLRRLLHE